MRFLSDENFNGAILRGLMRRLPKLDLATKRKPRALFVYKNERRDVSVLIKAVRYRFN